MAPFSQPPRATTQLPSKRSVMAEHTKEEWKVDDSTATIRIKDKSGFCITTLYVSGKQSPTSIAKLKANAHLIAAAPDQNTALKGLVDWFKRKGFDRELPEFREAEKALAKAEEGG